MADDLTRRVEVLEAAVLALGIQEFGDVDGHPFHGNQYSGGSGTRESSSELAKSGDAARMWDKAADSVASQLIKDGPRRDDAEDLNADEWEAGVENGADLIRNEPTFEDKADKLTEMSNYTEDDFDSTLSGGELPDGSASYVAGLTAFADKMSNAWLP